MAAREVVTSRATDCAGTRTPEKELTSGSAPKPSRSVVPHFEFFAFFIMMMVIAFLVVGMFE